LAQPFTYTSPTLRPSCNRSSFNKLLLTSTFQEFPTLFERSKAIERLERLELATACVSDWNVLNDWNDRLPMEVTW